MKYFLLILVSLFSFFSSAFLDFHYKTGNLNCMYLHGWGRGAYFLVLVAVVITFVYCFSADILSSNFLSIIGGFIVGGGVFHSVKRVLGECVLDYFTLWKFSFDIADAYIIFGLSILFIVNHKFRT